MQDLNQRLKEHLAYAYQHAPAVHDLFNQAGLKPEDIQTVRDLERLPITSKDNFSEMQQKTPPFGGWLASPIENLKRIYLSPGPIYDPHGDDGALIDGFKEVFARAGFHKGDMVINAFLYHMVPAGLGMDEALRVAGCVVVPLGPGNIEVHIKVMMDLKPVGYTGTPSFLGMILDKAAEMGLPKEAISFKKAFFTAEPYLPHQRAKFEGEYGIKTSQAYATADLGVIAYEVYGEEGFIIPQTQIVELVDPESGKWVEEGTPGEVVVTSFNRDYPLLRFGTGDMAVMLPGAGRLAGLVGRSGEAVKVRGMFLHPNQLRMAQGAFAGIAKLQAIVTREGDRDVVTLQVVKADGAELEAESLRQTLKNAARLTIDKVEFVAEIEGARLVRDAREWS